MSKFLAATLFNDLSEIPSLSISLPTDHFFGAVNGIYAQSGSTDIDSQDPLNNNWRRLATFEYIDPNNSNNYQQETGELTISGASSRQHSTTDKHNLRMVFEPKLSVLGRSQFRFDVAPFPGSTVKGFNQLQLRNPTHDSWTIKWTFFQEAQRSTSIRETWMRSIHKAMNPAPLGAEQPGNWVAHKRWVHLFINGLHWGIYEMTERVDEGFAI
jgi:hypothetical protein